MDKKTKIISVVIVSAVVIVLATIFYSDKNSNAVKVGVLLPLSGSTAYYGEESKNGLLLAERDLERKFPNINFELVYEDSFYTPKGGVDGYQKLSAVNGVKAVLVGGSQVAFPLVPLTEKDNILEMAIWSGAPSYTDKHAMNFRVTLTADDQIPPLLEYMQKNSLKRLGILHAENEFGVSFKNVFKQLSSTYNVNVISEQGFSNTETDFRTHLAKTKVDEPDAIFFVGTSAQFSTALKQAEELNVDIQFLSTTSAEDPVVANVGSAAERLVFNTNFDAEAPETVNFVKDYASEFSRVPTFYAAEAYVGLQLIAEAINSCKNEINATCWKNYLENSEGIMTILGVGKFNDRGDFKAGEVILKTIKDGKFVKLAE